jgi:hypothetical protein
MSASAIAQVLHSSLPRLSVRGQAMLDGLLLSGGSIGTAGEVAPHLGVRSRFQVARILRHDGLPPLHDLAAWMRMMSWLDRVESSGSSLCHEAFLGRKDPSACYREVKRLTGRHWGEVRRRGLRQLIAEFVTHCDGTTPSERTSRMARPVRRS